VGASYTHKSGRGEMELGNVLKTTYGANIVLGAYSGIKTETNPAEPRDDESQSIIRYLFSGRIAGDRQHESYANEAISVIQMFASKASVIKDKYARMQELAEKANKGKGKGSPKKLEEMQQEFEQLAGEINNIVNNTEWNGNRLFTDEGTTISISIGNNSTIDVIAKDLSIDVEGLDLTTDPERALATIQWQAAHSDYYSCYLEEQVERLGGAIQLIEFERYNDLGIKPEEFNMELAKQVAAYASIKTFEELSGLFDAQANVGPDRALELLKDKMPEDTE
jgi:hypothetical protein